MPLLANRRLRAGVELAIGAGVLLAGLGALPLGLASLASAPVVGAGYSLAAAAGPGAPVAPLCALVIRALAWLPAGDVATRANLASLLVAAVAIAGLGRLVQEMLAEVGRPEAVGAAREGVCESIAAVAGAGCVALAGSVFLAVTSASAAAVTLLVLAGFWLRAFRLMRIPGDTRDGLLLAFWAGLALGADPLVALCCWPTALVLWGRCLRQGERWPRLAPLLAAAGAGLGLFGAAAAEPPASGVAWLLGAGRAIFAAGAVPPLGRLGATARAALTEIGPVAVMVALVGLTVLARRAPRPTLVLAWWAGCALFAAAGQAGDAGSPPAGAARAAMLVPLAVPIAVGIAHCAGQLGRARVGAALVMSLVALTWPAVEGGGQRWGREAILPDRLLMHAHAAIAPRARVDAGSSSMAGLLRYGRALGLRPDLTLTSEATPPPR